MDIGTREPPTVIERPRTRARLLRGLASAGSAVRHRRRHLVLAGRQERRPTPSRQAANAPVPVLVSAAQQRDVPIWLDALGTVQAYSTVTVQTMVGGPLLDVDFQEGQPVSKGQVLARIDPRTYQAALDQAVAKKAQDEAQLANAKLDLARYQKLVQNNYTTGQTADTQKATVAQLTAQIQSDQGAIDNARTLLGYTTITSPIDGRAGIRQVDAGNIVQPNSTTGLVVLTQIKPISVLFNLPQQDLPQIAAAMGGSTPAAVVAMSEAGPGAGKVLDQGTLAVLDNQVDPTTGTIKLKATFPNPKETLWPGGFVRVRVQVATAHDAVTVPPAAVQRGPNGDYVYIVKPDRYGAAPGGDGRPPGRRDGDPRQRRAARPADRDRRRVAAVGRQEGDDRAGCRRAGARDAGRCRQGAQSGRKRGGREHLGALHRPPDRHLAAGDRDPARRRARLSGAARLGAAAGGLSDHRGDDAASRRQPGDDRDPDHGVAGTPVRADPGDRHHDLGIAPRGPARSRCNSSSAAASIRRPRTCRRRSTPPPGRCRPRFPTRRSIPR